MGLFDKLKETVSSTFKEALANATGTGATNQQNQPTPPAPAPAPVAQPKPAAAAKPAAKPAKTASFSRPALTNEKVEANGFVLGKMQNGEYSVLGYKGELAKDVLCIPHNIGNYTVTCIDRIDLEEFDMDWEAFSEDYGAMSIEIDEGIKYIGDKAFAGSSFDQDFIIDGLTLPNTLEYIGESAFEDSTITEFILPDSVIFIGKFVCEFCDELSCVTLSENLTEIPALAFSDCKKITEITFPQKLVTIGRSAFDGCVALTEDIIIPKSVKNIDTCAFKGCKFEKASFEPGSKAEIAPDAFEKSVVIKKMSKAATAKAVPVTAGDYRIKPYGNDGEYTVTEFIGFDEDVITIPAELDGKKITAIDRFICLGASKIIISEGIKHIGKEAFKESKCKEFVFPSTLETIGEAAFKDSSIESFILPDSVTELGKFCCEYCYDLKTLKLSSSLKKIPAYAFSKSNVRNLKIVEVEKQAIETIVIPEGVTAIDDHAFEDCGVTSLTLPESLLSVGNSAFDDHCLSELKLNSNLKTIGRYAFGASFDCDNSIDCINIPKSVAKIDSKAFCRVNAKSVYIETGSTVSLEDGCFAKISGLVSVSIPSSVTKLHKTFLWEEIEGHLSHSTGLGYEVTAGGNLKFREKHNYEYVSGTSFKGSLDENLTIYCEPGSAAYEYARKNEFKVARRVEE